MSNQIVKLQVPIVTNSENPMCLVYSRDRKINGMVPLTKEILDKMDGSLKKFFKVKSIEYGKNDVLKIAEEVEDQGW